jgi:uncharacterized RDD family membrane protein YckC
VIKQRATVGERAVYGFVDSLLFLFLWFVVTVCAEVKSPFGFHKRPYTEAHLLKYLEVMLWMTLAFFIGSIIFHRFAGGSPGKLMVGYRTQRVDGSRISWQDAIMRALAMFGLGMVILAPGPLAFYVFGLDPAQVSRPLLLAGLALWFGIALYPFRGNDAGARRPAIERWLGIETVWVSTPAVVKLGL